MRIRIIGGPGSGKTTIARQLAERYKIECHDLDEFYWRNEGEYGVLEGEDERDSRLEKVLRRKSWILEGVYFGGWSQPTIEQADYYFFIDAPILIAYFRLVKRFLRTKAGLEKGKERSVKDFFELLRVAWRYRLKRPLIEEGTPVPVKNFEDCVKVLE